MARESKGTMNTKERRETLAFLRQLAGCAERAADASGRNREYRELRAVIARQEREHRAFGRQFVGNIGARMSVEAATDVFVCRVLADGVLKYRSGAAPIAELDGIREDYVRGAILVSNAKYLDALLRSIIASMVAQAPGEGSARLARSCRRDELREARLDGRGKDGVTVKHDLSTLNLTALGKLPTWDGGPQGYHLQRDPGNGC